MNLSSSKFLISPTLTKFPAKYSISPNQSTKLGINFRCFQLIISLKKSSYQDFQEYAKPSRLLPVKEVNSSLEKVFESLSSSKSESLYKLRLQTSNAYGSGIGDVNSGVLLCLIDENGSSILQRLPATSAGADDSLRFQRGSVDEFAFEGPRLGRIHAVWISLESGQWRISGMNLRVISQFGEKNQEIKRYGFDLEDILLGEKGEASMMEFRPSSVAAAFVGDESTLFDEDPLPAAYPATNEEGMREYAYLKLSLLLYDAVLTLAGSAVASVSLGESAGGAFLIGGLLGFAYLLLVQRSVDELPAPVLVRREGVESGEGIFGRLRGSVLVLVLVFALAVVVVKYAASGEFGVRLASRDIVFGMMGFLMCKVALVLAAFKPVTRGLSENE
ncbi:hypothetical protein AAHA92_08022 [Salvia divinorum]|uniref:DUF7755 domain-containing protein n=1 Tax=Salvia divinorum TaxID=28513 RepID=A0ABD1HMB1_SALDI